MSIEYKRILRRIRYKLKDVNEASVSDYEIRDCLNEVIRYISMSNALRGADFNEKSKKYTLTDNGLENGYSLPADFSTIISVRADSKSPELKVCPNSSYPALYEYKISGGKIFCPLQEFVLYYKCNISEVESDSDSIDLPDFFFDSLVRLTVMVVQQTPSDVMQDAVDEDVDRMLPKRRYSNARIPMPFHI